MTAFEISRLETGAAERIAGAPAEAEMRDVQRVHGQALAEGRGAVGGDRRPASRRVGRYCAPMVAVVLAALGVFGLGVAAVLKGAGDRRGFRLALATSIALVGIGGGLAIAGAIRWRDCFRGAGGNYFRTTGTFNEHSGFTPTERCPARVLGVRDPF